MSMKERNRLALQYLFGAVMLFIAGYGLAWFSETGFFSKEVYKPTAAQSAEPTTPPGLKSTGGPDANQPKRSGKEYTVETGDTISGIAEKFSVPYEKIAQHNEIPEPYNLTVGQVIYIPE